MNKALEQLENAGILRRLNQREWGRVWECDELLDLVEDFERTFRPPSHGRKGEPPGKPGGRPPNR